MNRLFINNLYNLHKTSIGVAVFAASYALFPLLGEKNLGKAGICAAVALLALLLGVFTYYTMQKALVNNRLIYLITTLFYSNILLFSIYLCVWSDPHNLATIYLCFLMCSMLMFVNPPWFNLSLTLGAMGIFIVSTVAVKSPDHYIPDIVNTLIAGSIGLYINWQITKLRMGQELCTDILEGDRDKYFDQSRIDELTQLSNRRDFIQTFQRYLTDYRTSDEWLCVSISDIDFFKNYNDFYGHAGGDDCLRSIGKVFNQLKDRLGVYAARVGGEEFAMLWFEKDISNIDTVISDLTNLIKEMHIPHEKSGISEYVTVSVGVYAERCGMTTEGQTLYELADQALYAAKGSGRNCAIIHGRDIERYRLPAL